MAKSKTDANAAVAVAKKQDKQEPVTLSTGIRVRIVPVSAQLITECVAQVQRPVVPTWFDPNLERDVENPNHPDYIEALKEHDTLQGRAAMDALVMFGVELVDGVPEDDRWAKKLMLMEKYGHIDLSNIDFDDELEAEFAFKRYIAVSSGDYELLQGVSGVTEEMIDASEESFRGDEGGEAD